MHNGEERSIRISHDDIKQGVEDLLLHQLHESRALPAKRLETRFRGIPLTRNSQKEHTADLLLIGEDALLASVFYTEQDALVANYAGIVPCLMVVGGRWQLQRVLHFGHHNAYMLPRPADRFRKTEFKTLLNLALG